MKLRTFIILSIISVAVRAQTPSPVKILAGMFDSIKALKTVRFKAKSLERVGGAYTLSYTENKIGQSPLSIYMINPEKKLEILFVEGLNHNRAWVKPHVFPFITIPLDPRGNLMRKNQHYTLYELGFDFLGKAIAMALSKEKDITKALSYHGKKDINGYMCHIVVYENKNFGYFEYTVQKKETVTSIASKLVVNDFILRTKNDLLNDFGYLTPGSKLQVPTLYAKKVVLCIDEKSMLPMNITVFDDVGLFESYDYYDVIINKPIDPKEFTRSYKGYHF